MFNLDLDFMCLWVFLVERCSGLLGTGVWFRGSDPGWSCDVEVMCEFMEVSG